MSKRVLHPCDCLYGYREMTVNFICQGVKTKTSGIVACPFCSGKGVLTGWQKYKKDIEINRFCTCENVGSEIIYIPPAVERFGFLMMQAANLGMEIMEAHYMHRACGKVLAIKF